MVKLIFVNASAPLLIFMYTTVMFRRIGNALLNPETIGIKCVQLSSIFTMYCCVHLGSRSFRMKSGHLVANS